MHVDGPCGSTIRASPVRRLTGSISIVSSTGRSRARTGEGHDEGLIPGFDFSMPAGMMRPRRGRAASGGAYQLTRFLQWLARVAVVAAIVTASSCSTPIVPAIQAWRPWTRAIGSIDAPGTINVTVGASVSSLPGDDEMLALDVKARTEALFDRRGFRLSEAQESEFHARLTVESRREDRLRVEGSATSSVFVSSSSGGIGRGGRRLAPVEMVAAGSSDRRLS